MSKNFVWKVLALSHSIFHYNFLFNSHSCLTLVSLTSCVWVVHHSFIRLVSHLCFIITQWNPVCAVWNCFIHASVKKCAHAQNTCKNDCFFYSQWGKLWLIPIKHICHMISVKDEIITRIVGDEQIQRVK